MPHDDQPTNPHLRREDLAAAQDPTNQTTWSAVPQNTPRRPWGETPQTVQRPANPWAPASGTGSSPYEVETQPVQVRPEPVGTPVTRFVQDAKPSKPKKRWGATIGRGVAALVLLGLLGAGMVFLYSLQKDEKPAGAELPEPVKEFSVIQMTATDASFTARFPAATPVLGDPEDTAKDTPLLGVSATAPGAKVPMEASVRAFDGKAENLKAMCSALGAQQKRKATVTGPVFDVDGATAQRCDLAAPTGAAPTGYLKTETGKYFVYLVEHAGKGYQVYVRWSPEKDEDRVAKSVLASLEWL